MTAPDASVTLFLCGDVMTGRGIDQILAHPSAPDLYEPLVGDAREYVALAEAAHGPLPRRVDAHYVWGVTLAELAARKPHARIVNLETSVTTSENAEPKGINYRMHPANANVLTAVGLDCAVLANNHVLDWGRDGLAETLATLAEHGIRTAGAGDSLERAESPVRIDVAMNRLLVFGIGGPDCGIPPSWSASVSESGVFRIDDFSPASVDRIATLVARFRGDGDLVIASIHWGGNWGYDIPDEHRRFAHALIDRAGVDLVHGHSSHHPRGIELHRGRAILYGCGDFLNDYEGIPDREAFRSDLAFMYFPTLDARSGELLRLEMVPLVIRKFSLQHPSQADREWLFAMMTRECDRLGTSLVEHEGVLRWGRG